MDKKSIHLLALILVYLITRVVYAMTGFSYSFTEGILNIKLLIDLGLWVLVYLIIQYVLGKVSAKGKEDNI